MVVWVIKFFTIRDKNKTDLKTKRIKGILQRFSFISLFPKSAPVCNEYLFCFLLTGRIVKSRYRMSMHNLYSLKFRTPI